jgi:glycosyltransferase involved in cell wall biosynthesis
MERNIILTVLVPVYNTEAYLDKCLGSLVVSNDLINLLEVLVVIDGSMDHSIEIARRYETNYPNTFRVIDKENGGHGSCCNVGVYEAKGKYIHFLDSDDWFDDNFSSYLLRLKDENSEVVFTKRIDERVFEKKTILHEFSGIEYEKSYTLESLRNVEFAFSIHEVSYSVDLFRKYNVRFREKASYDDAILAVAGFLGVETIAFYNLTLYHYLIGRPGQSWDPIILSNRFKNRCYTIHDCFDLYEKSQSINSTVSNVLIIRSIGWLLERIYSDAWKQNKNQSKQNISFLNELFRESIENNKIKKNYLVAIAIYLPFSCGYFLLNNVIRRFF